MELLTFADPGATPGAAKRVAGLRGTGSVSQHREGSCLPSRSRELLPAPQRALPAFVAPGANPGAAKGCYQLSQHRELFPAPHMVRRLEFQGVRHFHTTTAATPNRWHTTACATIRMLMGYRPGMVVWLRELPHRFWLLKNSWMRLPDPVKVQPPQAF